MGRQYGQQEGISANNTAPVVLDVAPGNYNHTIYVSIVSGTPSAGTFAVSLDGQAISGTITATSLAPMVFQGHVSRITVVPSGVNPGVVYKARHIGTM